MSVIYQFFHSMVFDVLAQVVLTYFMSTLFRLFQRVRSCNASFLLPLFLQDFLFDRGSGRSSSPLYVLILWDERYLLLGRGQSYVMPLVSNMVSTPPPPFCSPFKVSVAAFDDGGVASRKNNSINRGLMSGLSIV